MKVIYISGRYRSKWGLLGVTLNIWKARRAARKLWEQGWAVICPHSNTAFFNGGEGIYLRGDIEIVKRCDAIYMLKGWQRSEGTGIDYQVAIAHGLEIKFEE